MDTVSAVSFAQPLVLLLLLPWAGLAVWLLRGRGEARAVPFVRLWPGEASTAKRRRWRPPPWPVVAGLLAVLCGLLAAARPEIGGAARPVTVIVDCGATMPPARRDAAVRRAAAWLGGGDAPVRLVLEPGGEVVDATRRTWAAAAESAVTRSAAGGDAIRQAAVREATGGRAVVVVSDTPTDAGVQFAPPPVANAAVARAGVADDGRVLVRLAGEDVAGRRVLLDADGEVSEAVADAAGEVRRTLAAVPERLEVRLAERDVLPADDVAWWVRPGRVSVVNADAGPTAARFAAAWSAARGGGPTLVTLARAPGEGRRVVVRGGELGAGDWDVRPHPVVDGIDVREALSGGLSAAPAGWRPVVSVGGVAVVAVNDRADRQVWVGAAPERPTAAFVSLLASAVEWAGGAAAGGPEALLAGDAATAEYAPRPGVWQTPDGPTVRAVGPLRPGGAADVGTSGSPPAGRIALWPWLLAAAAWAWLAAVWGGGAGGRRA